MKEMYFSPHNMIHIDVRIDLGIKRDILPTTIPSGATYLCIFFCSVDINGIVRKLIELDIKKINMTRIFFCSLLNLILSIFMM